MDEIVGKIKQLFISVFILLCFTSLSAQDRDTVWVWYGDSLLTEIDALVGDTLLIDVFIETAEAAYVADILMVLGFDVQYFDTLISEVFQIYNYPFTQWDGAFFYQQQGSPPNQEGWMSQGFQGFANIAFPYDAPWLHVENPYHIISMAALTANSPDMAGQTVPAIGPGLNAPLGPSNAGDTLGGLGYEVVEFFSQVHFIAEVGYLEGHVEDSNNDPIEGVNISVSPSDETTTSDELGYYFLELSTGVYQVSFSHPNYADTTLSDVLITLGQTTTLDVQLSRLPAGYVTGIITDTSGTPIANIFVNDSQRIDEDTTDTDGSYILELPQGAYVIEFDGIGYRDTSVSDIVVNVNQTTYVDIIMNIDESEYDEIPETIIIRQNYPNPFNTGTTIEFELEKPMRVKIEIFDVLGRKVETIGTFYGQMGLNTVNWNPADIASGIYFCRIRSRNNDESKAMLFIR